MEKQLQVWALKVLLYTTVKRLVDKSLMNIHEHSATYP